MDCFLYDFKEPSQKSVKSMPIVDYIWDEGIKVMKNPVTVTLVLPRLDKKYKAPEVSLACLTGHPKLDSVIAQAAQRRSRNPSAPISTLPDKEGKRLDNMGKRFSLMALLIIRAFNSLAIIGRYDRQLWVDIAPYLDQLPEESKLEAKKVLQEGERSSAKVIDCVMDIATTAF
ncbi:hypothetical protein NDU88_005054 [Pleurodeles waltl]|uniref:Uncharacterized protein n=1 Tax=Pleurodeles waltl TaxID=8319 RepID=A0AAV7MDG0_PLEWA|nr:hypothetical protein NDU88_005054 [Pleurodeles waltl]